MGKHVRQFASGPWAEVIGVVQNVCENGVDQKAPPTVYWPSLAPDFFGPGKLGAIRSVTLVLRSQRAGSESFVRQVQHAIWSANSALPIASVRTMREVYDQSPSRTSFTLVILGIAGAMALILGVVGIYGVLSYTVSQRRREMGIRLALGARQAAVKKMFVLSALLLVGSGAGIGLITAAGLTRLMKSLLFGISPLDPWTYAAVIAVLGLAAVVASYLPARRAANVDPVEILKAD